MSTTSRTRIAAVTAAGTGLLAGLALGITGLASASASTPTSGPAAGAATGQAHGDHRGPRGDHRHGGRGGALVTAVNGNTISLDTPSGPKTVTVDSSTVYRHGGVTASLADVKPNEIVRVRLVDPAATSPVARQVSIEMARADGYVTGVTGQSFTVIGRDGFARSVQASSTTVYQDAGKTGSPAEIAVGKFVRAAGNVDPNGTTLDATRISTGNGPRMMGSDGGPAMMGPVGSGNG